MTNHSEEIHAIWVDPTQFDPLRHAPPFLPSGSSPVKLAAQQKAQVQGWVKQAQMGSEVEPYLRSMAESYNSPLGWMSALLTCLRSAALIHQTHHWQTRGLAFYGDHQLFMRLYEDSVPFVDSLAEKTVGLGNPSLVDPVIQAKHLAYCVAKCYESAKAQSPDGMVQVSLQKEYCVLEAVKVVLHKLGEAGILSDGTENLLQGIADKHEEFVYLLKQRSDAATYSYAR